MSLARSAIVGLLLLTGACTTLEPTRRPTTDLTGARGFPHDDLARVLDSFVDDEGLVDYAALHEDPAPLRRYYDLLSRYSPDATPGLFAGRDGRLAYWINAYNADVMVAVVEHYPIESVLDVERPFLFFFFPETSGFFYFQRMRFGSEEMSLHHLENEIIRERFDEPRIHFALNCASLGCPRLPREPFVPDRLDEQLERETRKFLGEERNLRFDHERRVVFVSQILEWYRDDFIGWLERHHPEEPTTLLGYVSHHVPPDRSAELQRASDYEIRFIPYDWSLNDQR